LRGGDVQSAGQRRNKNQGERNLREQEAQSVITTCCHKKFSAGEK
jgi:hypothetical protein